MVIQSKKYGKMGHYVHETHIVRNNLVSKRPPVGYETKEDREYMASMAISEWQVFFKGFLIGEVYFQSSINSWIYQSTEETGHNIVGQTFDKGFAVQRLYDQLKEKESSPW